MKISTTSAVALGILWELEPALSNAPPNWSLTVKDAPHGNLDYTHEVYATGIAGRLELLEEGRQTPERFRTYLMELAARALTNRPVCDNLGKIEKINKKDAE